MVKGQLVVNRCPRIVFPSKGLTQIHQFAVKALNTLGFGHRPRANARRVEEGEVGLVGRQLASRMQRHEVARIVVQQHREA